MAPPLVGRTPWSAADAPVGLCGLAQEAGPGAGCRPEGLPHIGDTRHYCLLWLLVFGAECFSLI
jgi:hypothetical protein